MLSGVFHLHEQDARQVMTPIPAVVTVDVSDDVESALRRCIECGHTRLVVTEDRNQDRVRGLVHANALARALMADGSRGARGAGGQRRADRARDQAARRPARRAAAPAGGHGRRGRRVRPRGRHRDRRGHHRGGRRRDRGRDGPARAATSASSPTATGSCAVTWPSPTSTTTASTLPVDAEAYNSVGGLVFTTLGRLPRRGDTVSADGFSIRVESVSENRVEAVRIRERRAVSRGGWRRAERGLATTRGSARTRASGASVQRGTFHLTRPPRWHRDAHSRTVEPEEERWAGDDPPHRRRPARGGAGRSFYGRRYGYEVRRSRKYRRGDFNRP